MARRTRRPQTACSQAGTRRPDNLAVKHESIDYLVSMKDPQENRALLSAAVSERPLAVREAGKPTGPEAPACPCCASPETAIIGRQGEALICGSCGRAWAISAENPLYLRPLGDGQPHAAGECPACGRVLKRTWTGNGAIIVHGPRAARCPGSGRQPARRRASARREPASPGEFPLSDPAKEIYL